MVMRPVFHFTRNTILIYIYKLAMFPNILERIESYGK